MTKPVWYILSTLLVGFLGLSLVRPVKADEALVNLLLSQPCSGGWEIRSAYPPYATCYGLDQTVVTTTLIPVPRAYKTAPEYPFVGLMTALGVDWDPVSFGVTQTQTDIYLPEDDWFVNYRVEVKISSYQENQSLFNAGMGTNRFYNLQDHMAQVAWGYEYSYLDLCPQYTLEYISTAYGGWGGCRSLSMIESQLGAPFTMRDSAFYEMGGARPDWFWLDSQITSKNGSSQNYGEPAFGFQITTHWTVWARSTWDHYYDWTCWDETVIDPVTGLPILDPVTGDPMTTEVCDWIDQGSGGGYIYLGSVGLDYIVVPTQGVQQFYPVPVFQSQPLLSLQ